MYRQETGETLEMAFIKDKELTQVDFGTYELAAQAALRVRAHVSDPKELQYRVRIKRRSRTGKWDVVVKVRRDEPKPAPEKKA